MFGIVTISFSNNGRVANNESSGSKNNVVEGFDETSERWILVYSLIGFVVFLLIVFAFKKKVTTP